MTLMLKRDQGLAFHFTRAAIAKSNEGPVVHKITWTTIGFVALTIIGCHSKPTPLENQATPTASTHSQPPLTADQEVVRDILAEQFQVKASVIEMDRPISDPPLGADDLDIVEIVMELEDRFGVTIPDAAVAVGDNKAPMTPNQLVSIVREAQKNKGAATK